MKRFIALLSLLGLLAVPAAYAVDPPGNPSREALHQRNDRGFLFETNDAGTNTVGVMVYFVSSDTAPNAMAGVTYFDTGTEACAVFKMDCVDTLIFDASGGTGDEFTDAACTDDLTDNAIGFAICN